MQSGVRLVWDSMALVRGVGVRMGEAIGSEPSCMFNDHMTELGKSSGAEWCEVV